jgi:hypothetical protein
MVELSFESVMQGTVRTTAFTAIRCVLPVSDRLRLTQPIREPAPARSLLAAGPLALWRGATVDRSNSGERQTSGFPAWQCCPASY